MDNQSLKSCKTIGIDCSNIKMGGGVTHIIEILRYFKPSEKSFDKIVVWGNNELLESINDEIWISKINPFEVSNPSAFRVFWWKTFDLSKSARRNHCDLLFIPGGVFLGNFRPFITMSQNMLPFEFKEIKRYGFSFSSLKFLLLRLIQLKTMNNSNGIIFLTNYAKGIIVKNLKTNKNKFIVIPHGIDDRFRSVPKKQFSIFDYSSSRPYKIVYVSAVLMYKHQWTVVEAVSYLRTTYNWPIQLDLVGPAQSRPYKKLIDAISKFDENTSWIKYHGNIEYNRLQEYYQNADLCIFASSCENLPITLIECMASNNPIACSNMGPMPEILQDAGIYFNPERPMEIASALFTMINSPSLRQSLAIKSSKFSGDFNWRRTSNETFDYLYSISK
jgi:glycosyltransferase involved in cell wall biosynthesis